MFFQKGLRGMLNMDCISALNIYYVLKTRTMPFKIKKDITWGRPGGAVVKFARSTSVAWDSQIQILGVDLRTAYQAML